MSLIGIAAKTRIIKPIKIATNALSTTNLDQNVSTSFLNSDFVFLGLICLWNILINAGNSVSALNTQLTH